MALDGQILFLVGATEQLQGFTLVELLIAIIVIGALAGTYLLVSSKVAAKADAIKIVNNMRALKTATSMYYMDNGAWPGGNEERKIKMLVDTYLDRELSFTAGNAPYNVWGGNNNVDNVWVKCFLTKLPEDGTALREALKKIAEKKLIPLYNDTQNDKYPVYNGGDEIVMPIKLVIKDKP